MKKLETKKLVTLIATLGLFTFAFTGCGGVNSVTDAKDQTTEDSVVGDVADGIGDAAEDLGDAAGDMAEDAGDAIGDVADGAADMVGDAAEGVGNATSDLIDGTNGFNNYQDAHDYLIQQMGYYDNGAVYEIRNENRDLVKYDDNDSKREGYEFELYDTAQNKAGKKLGTYYVDSKKGTIYQKDDAGKGIEAVEFSQDLGTSVSSNKKNK